MSQHNDPRLHTAEHVINQTMIRVLGCRRSYSMQLESRKGRVDYAFAADVSDADMAEVERRVNTTLALDLPVTEQTCTVAEAAGMVDVSKLPPQLAADPEALIRIVAVGDYDICPCSGEHLSSTAGVGEVRLASRSFTPAEDLPAPNPQGLGRLRVRFTVQPTS